jgi:uncharacterized protein
VGCRARRPKRALLRIVRTPAGRVEMDATGKAPGRGAYVDRDPGCIRTALSKGAVARVLRTSLGPGDLATLREQMERAIT